VTNSLQPLPRGSLGTAHYKQQEALQPLFKLLLKACLRSRLEPFGRSHPSLMLPPVLDRERMLDGERCSRLGLADPRWPLESLGIASRREGRQAGAGGLSGCRYEPIHFPCPVQELVRR